MAQSVQAVTRAGFSGRLTGIAYSNTAATVDAISISGWVVSVDGRGVARAAVSLTDQNGRVRIAITNPFGYYTFNEIESGRTYTSEVRSKEYIFGARILTPGDIIVDLDFVGK